MAGAAIETTLELWASSLREVKARIRPLFAQERAAVSGLIVAVGVGLLAYTVFSPLLETAWGPVRAWTATREGHQLYGLPYGWQILVPAYLTFTEAVVGAFLVAAAVSNRIPVKPKWAWLGLVGLIFALRGVFFSCFTEIPISGLPAPVTILSVGQFALESLCLAVVVASAWMLAVRPQSRASSTAVDV